MHITAMSSIETGKPLLTFEAAAPVEGGGSQQMCPSEADKSTSQKA